MSLLTKETDLLQFINQKKQENIDVPNKKIVTNYCKVITNSITKCYEKVSVDKYCIICMETIDHLFWVLFMYSKNLKLTMFLCDRAILLFNEYIIMTKSSIQGLTSKDNVHLTDVKSFVYKKTIGPLTLNSLHFKKHSIKHIIDICNIFKTLYINFTINFLQNNEDHVDNSTLQLTSCLEEIFANYLDVFLNNITSDNNSLLPIIEDFQDQEEFTKLVIPAKHTALLILIKLCLVKSSKKFSICHIRRYYKMIYLKSRENYKKNPFKKEILNIKVDEFYKLLQIIE